MTLTVGTNISALSALETLGKSSSAVSTSMQRLSTGSQINSSADNAAGVALSQSISTEINGIGQVVQNTNDAINMLQTADSAMNTQQQMLQTMRTLAIQSANGTYSTSQRSYMQAEFRSLASQIDNVANQTTWNGESLQALGGTQTSPGTPSTPATTTTTSQISSSDLTTNSGASLVSSSPPVISFNGTNGTAVINNTSLNAALASTNWTLSFQVKPTKSSSTEQALFRVEGAFTSGINPLDDGSNDVFFNTGNSIYSESSPSLVQNQWNTVSFSRDNSTLTVKVNGATVVNASNVTFPSYSIPQVAVGGMVGNNRYAFGGEIGSIAISTTSSRGSSSSQSGAITSSSGTDTVVQAGTNANDKISINAKTLMTFSEMTSGLSLSDAISTVSGASSSIASIDSALNAINNLRSQNGASVNQLSYSAQDDTSFSANMISTRAHISDTDYASETAALAKNQIIEKAATAMVAQASDIQKQAVMGLLKNSN